jgi:amino acid transporter
MVFPFLSLLTLGSSSAQVITWLANLTEAAQIIDYICMATIYIFFHRALKAQGIDRSTLPYIGWWQPYCAWFGLVTMTIMVCIYGYTTFLPGYWDIGVFFSYYTMCFVFPVLFVGWKIIKKTKFVKPHEADLVWDRPVIDAYEAALPNDPTTFWQDIKKMAGFGGKKANEHTI